MSAKSYYPSSDAQHSATLATSANAGHGTCSMCICTCPCVCGCPACGCVPCAECNGQGEIGTRQDYFGNWDTEECRCCRGYGEITTERAAEWRALLEDYS